MQYMRRTRDSIIIATLPTDHVTKYVLHRKSITIYIFTHKTKKALKLISN